MVSWRIRPIDAENRSKHTRNITPTHLLVLEPFSGVGEHVKARRQEHHRRREHRQLTLLRLAGVPRHPDQVASSQEPVRLFMFSCFVQVSRKAQREGVQVGSWGDGRGSWLKIDRSATRHPSSFTHNGGDDGGTTLARDAADDDPASSTRSLVFAHELVSSRRARRAPHHTIHVSMFAHKEGFVLVPREPARESATS